MRLSSLALEKRQEMAIMLQTRYLANQMAIPSADSNVNTNSFIQKFYMYTVYMWWYCFLSFSKFYETTGACERCGI